MPRKQAKKTTKIIEVEGELVAYHDAYDPSYDKLLVPIAEAGGHKAAMMRACKIKSSASFNDWLEKYPTFKDAYERAMVASQAYWEHQLHEFATGKQQGNATAFALILNNKFSEDYKRGTGGGNQTNINVEQMNTINTNDPKLIDERILELQKKLNLLPTEVPNESREA